MQIQAVACFFFFRLGANRSHVKAVKIGASLFVLSIITYTPLTLADLSHTVVSGYFYFSVFINNFANFFVYVWVDVKFRNWLLGNHQ